MRKQLPDGKIKKRVFTQRWWSEKIMAKHLFDACRKFDKVYPEAKPGERLKRHMMELSSHYEKDPGGKLISTLKKRIQ